MAEDKKSFILYADQIHLFENLEDDEAGRLIKHIFRYVNDQKPECDRLTTVAFEPIKRQFKRDLVKWEEKKGKASDNGRKGNLKRYYPDLFEKVSKNEITIDQAEVIANGRKTSLPEEKDRHLTKTVANLAVNVNVNANVNDINKIECPVQDKTIILDYLVTKESTYEEKAVKQFHTLFCKLATPEGGILKDKTLMKAKMDSWMKDMGLLLKTDKRTHDELKEVYDHLNSSKDRFWSTTVSSISGIRKNFDKIMAKIRLEKQKQESAQIKEQPKLSKNESKSPEAYY